MLQERLQDTDSESSLTLTIDKKLQVYYNNARNNRCGKWETIEAIESKCLVLAQAQGIWILCENPLL
jgi:hypothetical protein